MADSLLHQARLALQPFLPSALVGLGAWARLAYKTRGFTRPQDLRRRWAERLQNLSGPLLSLDEFEARVLSQNGEDGLLEAIFHVIGFRTHSVLEFGFAATEASLLTLALSHDLEAYFVDGSAETCQMASALVRFMNRPRLHVGRAFMTADNINDVIRGMGVTGEIDALSIDVEGNDFWLWQALTVVTPRLVVAEYNERLGSVASVAIAYDPAFKRSMDSNDFYRGASLAAMTKLANVKGYRLISAESAGVSAFFLRNDIDAPSFPTLSVESAFRYHNSSLTPPADHDVITARLPFVEI